VKWTVEFYRTPSGRRPAEEWLSRQPKEIQARFAHVARLLEEFGLDIGRPHVAPAGQGIWEMRAVGSDRRMLYSVARGHKFVVLHGLAGGTGNTLPRSQDCKGAQTRLASAKCCEVI